MYQPTQLKKTTTPLVQNSIKRSSLRYGFLLVLLTAAITLGAAGPAGAQFPNCIKPADNQELNPNPDGTYPSDPAVPYTGTHTKWSTDGVVINLKIGDQAASQFYIKGVNYEPTQIGGGAGFPPFNDFFYTNSVSTYNPLWSDNGRKDIATLRAMGVNSIRTYGVWKWEVTFANGAPPPHNGRPVQDGLADFWQLLNFSVSDETDNQFCDPDVPQPPRLYALKHPTHKPFLDKLWNNGVKPIYIWIGLSVPLDLVDPNTSAERKANLRQFYRYTAKWLAKKYGNHPAVIGFIVGNEVDTAGTTPHSEFWETLNDLNAVVKASAPDKLTAVTFHDTDDYNRTIIDGTFNGQKGPAVYQSDVWGFNPYTNPEPPGNLFTRFKANIIDTNHVKPLMYGEFGTPADTHMASQDAAKAYPIQWVGVNFVWQENPPPAQCLGQAGKAPPPGSGGNGPDAEYAAGRTIALELPAQKGNYRLPKDLAPLFPNSGFKEGDSLNAADQADWIADFWRVTLSHKASNGPNRDSMLLYSSGGYVFEWRDEWWKGNEGHACFHSISGTQNCGSGWQGCPAACNNTGAANVVFPGGWGDEEWFGVTGAKVQGRMNCDPVINPSTGTLNGGPDILIPRAPVAALYQLFNAP
ncbi:MAG TPA: hypothetical protein VGI25_01555 [Candidatus Udaeobacter sp.]